MHQHGATRLLKAILIRAVEDYAKEPDMRDDIRNWSHSHAGTFPLIAHAIGVEFNALEEMFNTKLDRIEQGETWYDEKIKHRLTKKNLSRKRLARQFRKNLADYS